MQVRLSEADLPWRRLEVAWRLKITLAVGSVLSSYLQLAEL